MATYAIGDLHGCYDQLQDLLQKIKFNPNKDKLWFTGDLINGGPKPVEVLQFIKSLGKNAVCILGNHDLVLLGVAAEKLASPKDRDIGFDPILKHPKSAELIAWLKTLPFVHYDPQFNALLVHAGVLPNWNLQQILTYNKELELALHQAHNSEFFEKMFGNQPDTWDDKLEGWDRLRFFMNCFTRMRFCNASGKLELHAKGNLTEAPDGYASWFRIANRKTKDIKIIFGHWAALKGEVRDENVYAIDSGCVWGNNLTALRLDDWQKFSVKGLQRK